MIRVGEYIIKYITKVFVMGNKRDRGVLNQEFLFRGSGFFGGVNMKDAAFGVINLKFPKGTPLIEMGKGFFELLSGISK